MNVIILINIFWIINKIEKYWKCKDDYTNGYIILVKKKNLKIIIK